MNISKSTEDDVRTWFGKGKTLKWIREELGIDTDEMSFEEFMQIIGVSTQQEYTRQLFTNYSKERTDPEWKKIRKYVIERDQGKCVICGSAQRVHVHHIVPFKLTENNSYSNLTTLCYWHHAAAHGWSGKFEFYEYCLLANVDSETTYSRAKFDDILNAIKQNKIKFEKSEVTKKADARFTKYYNEYYGYLLDNHIEWMSGQWRKSGLSEEEIDDIIKDFQARKNEL